MPFTAGWTLRADMVELKSCIFRNNGTEIAIDLEVDNYIYTTVLVQQKPNHYSATFTRRNGSEFYEGTANAQLFVTESGYLLFGRWNEDGDYYKWWVEIENDE